MTKRAIAKCDRTGKTKFHTEVDAMIFLARVHGKNSRLRKLRQQGNEPTRAYRCEFCRNWHLTSQTKREGLGVE
jgi:hypothetical protein